MQTDTNLASRAPEERQAFSNHFQSPSVRGGVREGPSPSHARKCLWKPVLDPSRQTCPTRVLHCKSPPTQDPDCRTRCSVMAKKVQVGGHKNKMADRKGQGQAESGARGPLGRVWNPSWRRGGPATLSTGRKLAGHSENGLVPCSVELKQGHKIVSRTAVDATFCHPCCGSEGSLFRGPWLSGRASL